jgi:pyridoxal 5'-phosphate synthase pdxT subunit
VKEKGRAGADPSGPVGVLAIQGSFPLHLRALKRLGVEAQAVRRPSDLEGIVGLIIPGGESTVMSLLAREYGLYEPLKDLGRRGLPIMGTCAGAILLGRGEGPPPRLELAPVDLARNAYGTQIDSFTAPLSLEPFKEPFHGVFIRAPRITGPVPAAGDAPPGPRPEVLGSHDGSPVMVRIGNLLLLTFHPELTEDLRVHEYFLDMIRGP